MYADLLECGPKAAAGISSPIYAERLDMHGSFLSNVNLNKPGCWLQIFYPQCGVKVKVLISDNGGAYTGDEFMTYCHRSGIRTIHTAPRTPEQNGICERFNRTLVEALRTVLLTSRMARSFWVEFVLSITYTRNHLPHSSLLDDMSPTEAAFGTVPDVSRFKTLGCDCYTILDTE